MRGQSRALNVDIEDGNFCATLKQGLGELPPKLAEAAGDDDNFVLNIKKIFGHCEEYKTKGGKHEGGDKT